MVQNARCADLGFRLAGGSVRSADATFRVALAVRVLGQLTATAPTVESVYGRSEFLVSYQTDDTAYLAIAVRSIFVPSVLASAMIF